MKKPPSNKIEKEERNLNNQKLKVKCDCRNTVEQYENRSKINKEQRKEDEMKN